MSAWFGRKNDFVTIVSGLPRSGTSLMMRMLDAGGLSPLTDGEREADTDNPRGYYELERVKQLPKGDVAWLDGARGRGGEQRAAASTTRRARSALYAD